MILRAFQAFVFRLARGAEPCYIKIINTVISTILGQLDRDKKPLIVALFLVGVLGGLGLFFFYGNLPAGEAHGILGGPVESSPDEPEDEELSLPPPPFVLNDSAIVAYSLRGGGFTEGDFSGAMYGGLFDPGQPIGPASRGNLLVYRVQSGDTLSGIAAFFGVSLDTLINANPGVRARLIKPGDELNVLPVSGVVYTTQDGDTLESVAAYFNISENQIIQYNQGIDFGNLGMGISLIIPGVKSYNLTQNRTGSLPSFGEHFSRPAEGFNWGQLHNYNAVDVANSCGTPIRAAAEGLVISAVGDGWNDGYGKFILIEHPFGDNVRTRYAHLATAGVSIGDYVEQGQIIGAMGETGDATGCHVHFEVYGAVNPLAR